MVCLKRLYNVSCASLAQLVEHRSRKAGVTSSSLVAGSMKSQVVALWRLLFLCEWLELFDCFSATETALPEWWVVILALPEQRCQKCAKLGRHFGAAGTALPKMRQVGRKLPNLQQVWFKYAKLAVSMAI